MQRALGFPSLAVVVTALLCDWLMNCVGHDRVLVVDAVILAAEAPAVRNDLHRGQHLMAVALQPVTDETVNERKHSILLDYCNSVRPTLLLQPCSYELLSERSKHFYTIVGYFKFLWTCLTENSVTKREDLCVAMCVCL